MTGNKGGLEALVKQFDSFGYYLDAKLDRDIEEHRKGQFALCFRAQDGTPLEGVRVSVRQLTHEFKFGCSMFHLDQFRDERDKLYRQRFTGLFNYGVVPLYWDTLEPERGKPRFDEDCGYIPRRPPLDTIERFCRENGIRAKGHCLVYNSFQPDWLPRHNRDIRIAVAERLKAIADRYPLLFEDADVINEMLTIYKNCYPGNGARNLQTADDRDHEKWCFELCRRLFPETRLFWNEGNTESVGAHYRGYRSFYYMMIEKLLAQGVPVQGIGIQYHLYSSPEEAAGRFRDECNPLRLIDAFDCYGELGLPVHVSEISVPSYSNESEDEFLQAELAKRLYRLWFGRSCCEAIVWWNLADGTAYHTENRFHAGLLRGDCTEKPAYRALDSLINHEWRTNLDTFADGRLNFRGFYGDYEVEASVGGRTVKKRVSLQRDNTGYDNRLCDFRVTDIVL